MKHTLTLSRTYRPYITLGTLSLPSGKTLKTLERPWLNNQTNISCIPEGTYECTWLESSGSGKYVQVWHLQDVEGRTEILFHAGNLVRDTLGCILVGLKHGHLGGEDAVLSSLKALKAMRSELEAKAFTLIIK